MLQNLSNKTRFDFFLFTQSLGAFNDNFFKTLIQLFFVFALANESERWIAHASFVFTIPFVLFAPLAGSLADRFATSKLLQIIKAIETPIMILGVLAFQFSSPVFLILILFFMASQSAFFSPNKMGYLPKLFEDTALHKANGLLGLTTFVSIIFGTATAGILLTVLKNNYKLTAPFCIAFALVGFLSSLLIQKTKSPSQTNKITINPVKGLRQDLLFLFSDKEIGKVSLLNSFFWFLGLLFQTNVMVYARDQLKLLPTQTLETSLLPATMGIGIALGCFVAGRFPAKKLKQRLSLALATMSLCAFALALFSVSYTFCLLILFLAGVFGGLFVIPLNVLLQTLGDNKDRGRILATNGALNGVALVLASVFYRLAAVDGGLSANEVFGATGLLVLPVLIVVSL